MGKITGFKEFDRKTNAHNSVAQRIENFEDFLQPMPVEDIQKQASRCMDCGVPFCHSDYGCPLSNIIPNFNDEIYKGEWKSALKTLLSTNNFPEFTGRICPAPCESSCVLGIVKPSVAIKNIEQFISDKGYEMNWVKSKAPEHRTGKKVAIVGSGPAGLACADQLNKVGHSVTVFERDDRIGGLLLYGIPNFKLEKSVVFRRIDIMKEEGIVFKTNVFIGKDTSLKTLKDDFDAVVLACGSRAPRDLPLSGRNAKGIHFAMPFLTQSTRRILGDSFSSEKDILATKKDVLVIGGGDTGSDCVGTSIRQKAASVTQIELLPQPPLQRNEITDPWPLYPRIFRVSSSQEEGCSREFSLKTEEFLKDNSGHLRAIRCTKLRWNTNKTFEEIPNSSFEIKAQMLLLAMGFVHPEPKGLIEDNGIRTDKRGNVLSDNRYETNLPGVFVAGDMRRGQSLVVWAISEGRECAHHVDTFLKGSKSFLPQKKHYFAENV